MEEFSSKDDPEQSEDVPNQCRICGDEASGNNYGVISCQSCKIFFKRNAEQKQKLLKCRYDGQCEMNINTRHTCSYCRLAKCFSSGMQAEKIRSCHPKLKATNRKRTTNEDQAQTISRTLIRFNQTDEFPTLNLLQADHSTLTPDQGRLISNLANCFDEYSGFDRAERYVREQNALPVKLRYKPGSLIEFLQTLLDGTELIYKNNQDFLSLSSNDRCILLHRTIQHTSILCGNYVAQQVGLSNDEAFFSSVEIITHQEILPATKRLNGLFNCDMITMKLFLTIVSFSTISLTFYSPNASPMNLSNIKEVLRIQNTYIELAWRYLMYKYSYKEAVICFCDLIRCLFALHDILVNVQDIQWYTNKINSIIEQTAQTLNLNDSSI